MSLIRTALRMSVVEALRDKTFAGHNVLDSEIGAISIAADGTVDSTRSEPFISVYTAEASGPSLFERMKTDLVIDMAISSQTITRDDDGNIIDGDLPITPDSDRAYEVSIDVLHHQIMAALHDPENEWAEIARKILSNNIEGIDISVGRSSTKSRLAARQIRIVVNLLAEPVNQNLAATHPFAMFLAKLEEGDDDPNRDADFKDLATALRTILSGTHSGWKLDQFRYGMTTTEIEQLGLGGDDNTAITDVELTQQVP